MERIYDNPTWRAGQRAFLKSYREGVRESNRFRNTGQPQKLLQEKRYPSGALIEDYTLNLLRGAAKGSGWKHKIFMPWRKTEEHGNFIVINKPILDAKEEREMARTLGIQAHQVLGTLWRHDSIRGVYKWPRIIKVENYKGGGFPAYAWYARVVPR